MTKKQRAEKIIELLEKEYPLADCTLDYDEAWKLLVWRHSVRTPE